MPFITPSSGLQRFFLIGNPGATRSLRFALAPGFHIPRLRRCLRFACDLFALAPRYHIPRLRRCLRFACDLTVSTRNSLLLQVITAVAELQLAFCRQLLECPGRRVNVYSSLLPQEPNSRHNLSLGCCFCVVLCNLENAVGDCRRRRSTNELQCIQKRRRISTLNRCAQRSRLGRIAWCRLD